MAAVLKHWREAATLILVTSSKLSITTGKPSFQLTKAHSDSLSKNQQVNHKKQFSNDFDVLLMKRSSKSKFMPNLYVYPGGVAVDSDFSADWISVFNKLGPKLREQIFDHVSVGSSKAAPIFARQRDPAFSSIPSEVALRICAIRETFEESGVLLASPAKKSQSSANPVNLTNIALSPALLYEDARVIREWRDRVNKDPSEFLNMCKELNLVPEIWSLYEWSDWLTPTRKEENRRRFDTVFFVCCIDHKPEVLEDAAETVNAVWASPASFLSAYYREKGGLAPPQVYELARLLNFQSAEDLLKFVSQPDRERIERWLPVISACKDSVISVMPGDDLYPKNPDLYPQKNFPFYDETLKTLNQKHPNHNRTVFHLKSDSTVSEPCHVQCNILPRKGHVVPNIEALEQICLKAKL